MIPTRPLGQTGIAVPALGFGVAGPHATALVPTARTVDLVRRAASLGGGLYDTGPFYGDGEAERRLGAALEDMPDAGDAAAPFVITKVGTVRLGPGRVRKDFSPDHIRASLEESLERLGRDRVGAYLFHGPGPEHLTDEALNALADLKSSGLTSLVGVCARGAEIDACLETEAFDVVMAPVRLDQPADHAERLERVRALGLGLLAIEALTPSQPALRAPRSRADMWYAARGLKRDRWAAFAPGAALTVEACLTFALDHADAVITTTTRPANLAANARMAAEHG